MLGVQKGVGPGLLHDLIKNFDPLPPTFLTRRQIEAREREAKRNSDRWMVKQELEQRYEAYQQEAIDRFIAEEPEIHFSERALIQLGKPRMRGADQVKAASIQGSDAPGANDGRKRGVDRLPGCNHGIGDLSGGCSLRGEPPESDGNLAAVLYKR